MKFQVLSEDEVTRCLKRSVSRMLERHAFIFNGMVNRIDAASSNSDNNSCYNSSDNTDNSYSSYNSCDASRDLREGFGALAEELFLNGEVRMHSSVQ